MGKLTYYLLFSHNLREGLASRIRYCARPPALAETIDLSGSAAATHVVI
jgi:hypothetical protein